MSDLARQAVRGTLAVAAATAAARIVSFAGTLYLISVIRPGEFGVVDYAVALLAICGSLTDWGFSQAAIHRQERADETFSTYLVLRLGMIVGVLCLLAAAALPLHRLLEEKTSLLVLLVLGGTLVVEAGCEAPAARLARAMRFDRLMAVDVTSVVLATGVGVGMAALDFGVWALVGNRVTQAIARAVGLGAVSVDSISLRFHAQDARWLLSFGLPLWLGSVATTWVLRFDDLVVGSLRDQMTLGYYGRAYALALVPLSLVTGVLTKVSFPLYARLQSDRARLSEAFRLASGTTFRLAAPMAVGMALAIPDLLAVMGWTQWGPMVPLFRWLLIYTLVRPLMDDAGGLLTAVGRPRVTGHTLLGEAVALTVLCPLLTWALGAEGAAISVGAVVVAGLAIWYLVFLPRAVDIAARQMLLWPAVSVAAGGAAGMAVGRWAGLGVGLADGALKLAAVAVAYTAVLLALDGRQTAADLRALRRHAFGDRRSDG